MSVRIPVIALATAGVLATLAAPAGAAGDPPPWRCQASALSGTVLGQPIDPVTAGSPTGPCTTQSSTLGTALPAVLDASAVVASTSADATRALSAGGVADLRVGALPALPVALPEIPVPDTLGAVTVDLPSLPLLPLLPDSVTVDLRPAVDALLPDRSLPALDLLRVQGAVAYAAGRCVDGRPQLAGAASVAGVSVLGQQLPAGQLVDRTLALLDSGRIDLSDLDLSLVQMPVVPGLLEPVLRPLVETALQPVLDALPDIEIPATLAQVKVTPGAQDTTAGVLTQRALRIEVSIAGQSIADLTAGRASLAEDGVDCAEAAGITTTSTSTELALACTDRKVVLIDVLRRGRRVRLFGAADRSFAGQTVRIVFDATGRVVARATVRPDGSFETTAPLPRRSLRRSNLARYRALVAGERSLNLKLARRMVLRRTSSRDGRVTFTGRVLRPLARPRAPIVIKRRVTCRRSEVVGRARPRRDGRFRITVRAPEGQPAAVYRLTTEVRMTRRSRTTFRTFTLPRAIDLR